MSRTMSSPVSGTFVIRLELFEVVEILPFSFVHFQADPIPQVSYCLRVQSNLPPITGIAIYLALFEYGLVRFSSSSQGIRVWKEIFPDTFLAGISRSSLLFTLILQNS